ncbi:MAG: argininosuccinate lyase, partial [Actinomycetota bacterium]
MKDSSMLWSGRFKAGPDPEMLALSSSVEFDLALLEHDATVTKAHARALLDAGLLAVADLETIDACLDRLTERWRAGEVRPAASDEDVHTLVERTLTEELGDLGARIHAGRSRNDLVATDLRLWCRDACDELSAGLTELVAALSARAQEHADTVMPGFTHLQPGVPVSVAFHLVAHGFALARDARRLGAARAAADVSALGAGALAGTTLPLDPRVAQREMGFASLFHNAMDAVSDRDFVADLVFACATTCVHLSRLAEEIVIWATPQFGFARPSEAWSTGSSMMPNKRNPDMAELVRGRAAGAIGDLTGLLSLLKGLPLAYDRDLQEDKLYVFRAVERTSGCLRAMAGVVSGLVFDEARLAEAAASAGT